MAVTRFEGLEFVDGSEVAEAAQDRMHEDGVFSGAMYTNSMRRALKATFGYSGEDKEQYLEKERQLSLIRSDILSLSGICIVTNSANGKLKLGQIPLLAEDELMSFRIRMSAHRTDDGQDMTKTDILVPFNEVTATYYTYGERFDVIVKNDPITIPYAETFIDNASNRTIVRTSPNPAIDVVARGPEEIAKLFITAGTSSSNYSAEDVEQIRNDWALGFATLAVQTSAIDLSNFARDFNDHDYSSPDNIPS